MLQRSLVVLDALSFAFRGGLGPGRQSVKAVLDAPRPVHINQHHTHAHTSSSLSGELHTGTLDILQHLHLEHPAALLARNVAMAQGQAYGTDTTTFLVLAGLLGHVVDTLEYEDGWPRSLSLPQLALSVAWASDRASHFGIPVAELPRRDDACDGDNTRREEISNVREGGDVGQVRRDGEEVLEALGEWLERGEVEAMGAAVQLVKARWRLSGEGARGAGLEEMREVVQDVRQRVYYREVPGVVDGGNVRVHVGLWLALGGGLGGADVVELVRELVEQRAPCRVLVVERLVLQHAGAEVISGEDFIAKVGERCEEVGEEHWAGAQVICCRGALRPQERDAWRGRGVLVIDSLGVRELYDACYLTGASLLPDLIRPPLATAVGEAALTADVSPGSWNELLRPKSRFRSERLAQPDYTGLVVGLRPTREVQRKRVPLSVLVYGPASVVCRQRRQAVEKCVRRLLNALRDGVVLPGGGLVEASVAAELRRKAAESGASELEVCCCLRLAEAFREATALALPDEEPFYDRLSRVEAYIEQGAGVAWQDTCALFAEANPCADTLASKLSAWNKALHVVHTLAMTDTQMLRRDQVNVMVDVRTVN